MKVNTWLFMCIWVCAPGCVGSNSDWDSERYAVAPPEEALPARACPDDMSRIGEYCIDRYEAALAEFDDDGTPIAVSPYHPPAKNKKLFAVTKRGHAPQGYINQLQAKEACHNAGKRLCTGIEWLRACRGSKKRVFPYGNTRDESKCNGVRQVHPANELFRQIPQRYQNLQHPALNQLDNGLARTAAYSECVSEDGVYDMMGNLHEWTDEPTGTFRGGYYVDTKRNGPGCFYRTTAHKTSHWDYSTGFRCCADARE